MTRRTAGPRSSDVGDAKKDVAAPVYVLGISGSYNRPGQTGDGHDPCAVLLQDGAILAMAAEERFCRVKHAPGYFPTEAIAFCLQRGGITFEQVQAIGWSNDPYLTTTRWTRAGARWLKRAAVMLVNRIHQAPARIHKALNIFSDTLRPWTVEETQQIPLASQFQFDLLSTPFYCVDHHYAHAASAYYASGMAEATVITWDNTGGGVSCAIYHGTQGRLRVIEEFDQFSMGAVYTAAQSFLKLSDDGAVMGLAGYGTPRGVFAPFADPERLYMDLARIGRPFLGARRSSDLLQLLGRPPEPGRELEDGHKAIAADVQALLEAFAFVILRRALASTHCRDVAFAGGVALNAVMNGRIARSGLVDRVFVQPDAGDGGGALGAAFEAYRRLGYAPRPAELQHAFWGPEFADESIEAMLRGTKVGYERVTTAALVELTASWLADGKIVGWFQGRAEWGPRALGARSILADPRDPDMKSRINAAVKYRDEWRPFAPSILEEAAAEYLENVSYSPFMTMTFPVKPHQRRTLAAVVHVDGTTRPQFVRRTVAPLFYDLISRFAEKTGVPVVLNTSFNLKGEPIVNTPLDALRVFYSSGLDVLALGSFVLRK
jgi:carbamoyltransferase